MLNKQKHSVTLQSCVARQRVISHISPTQQHQAVSRAQGRSDQSEVMRNRFHTIKEDKDSLHSPQGVITPAE